VVRKTEYVLCPGNEPADGFGAYQRPLSERSPTDVAQDIDVVVTEHGLADLRGLSLRERAETIISACAHPDVRTALRDSLDQAVEVGGNVPQYFDGAFEWR